MKPCLMRCCSPVATRKSSGRTDDTAASTPASCSCSTSFCGDRSLPGHTLTAYAGADLHTQQLCSTLMHAVACSMLVLMCKQLRGLKFSASDSWCNARINKRLCLGWRCKRSSWLAQIVARWCYLLPLHCRAAKAVSNSGAV